MDGASNARGARIGIVLESFEGIKLECLLKLGFSTSNNEVEYEVLVAGLQAAMKLGIVELEVCMGLKIKLDKSTIVRRKRKFLKVVHTKQTI